MRNERKGLILSYRGRSKLATETPPGIHLSQNVEDKWNRHAQRLRCATPRRASHHVSPLFVITLSTNKHHSLRRNKLTPCLTHSFLYSSDSIQNFINVTDPYSITPVQSTENILFSRKDIILRYIRFLQSRGSDLVTCKRDWTRQLVKMLESSTFTFEFAHA